MGAGHALDDLRARIQIAGAPADPLAEALGGVVGDGHEDGHAAHRSGARCARRTPEVDRFVP